MFYSVRELRKLIARNMRFKCQFMKPQGLDGVHSNLPCGIKFFRSAVSDIKAFSGFYPEFLRWHLRLTTVKLSASK